MNKKTKAILAATLAMVVAAGGGVLLSDSINRVEAASLTPSATASPSASADAGATGTDARAQRGAKPPAGKGGFGGADRAELAAALGIAEDELKAALAEGKTLAAIAAEKGVAVTKVTDLIAAAIVEKLDEQLADGKITQAQYDERKAEAATRATEAANVVHEGGKGERGHGPGRGGKGGPGHGGPGGGFGGADRAELAAALGIAEDELKAALAEGKTLAAIAAEKGVAVTKVTDLIAAAIVEKLDEQLADGKITQAQYDERKAEAATRATEAANAVHEGGKGERGHGPGRGGRGGPGGDRGPGDGRGPDGGQREAPAADANASDA